MEISILAANSIKIKGKSATVLINPQEKSATYNAALIVGNPAKSSLKLNNEIVTITGPGEYEAGGIKITGMKADSQTVFTIRVDNIDILVGELQELEKVHQKLKEHNLALIFANQVSNTSFVPSLGMNATLFAGEKAREAIDTLAKDEKKEVSKYAITADKLPTETETILLS